MTRSNQLDFATRCIHAGQEPDPTTGAVMMPIYATSTYVQQSPGVNKGYDYARTKNPDAHGVRALHRRSRRRQRRVRLCVRPRGDFDVARMPRPGLPCHRGRRPLWRLAPAVRAGAQALDGHRGQLSRSVRPGCDRSGDPAEHPPGLGRDADQSAAQAGRPRARRRHRQKARHLGRRRQHIRQSLCAAPARAWLRPRRAFDDEVSQWPFRHGRRGGGRRRQRRIERAAQVSAECRRRHSGSVRFVFGAARPQDPGIAHGAALHLGAEDRRLARTPPQSTSGVLSRACQAIRSTRSPRSRCTPLAA